MPAEADVPPEILAPLRSICLALPEAYEEQAWTGTRWRVRKRTFAHVLAVGGGWPPAYTRAAGTDAPVHVVTFRSAGEELEALCGSGFPFFRPLWGTKWGVPVVGMVLEDTADWAEVAELLTESFRLLATKKLGDQLGGR